MTTPLRSCAAVAILLAASGCYSLARVGHSVVVRSETEEATLRVWVNSTGPVLSSPPNPVWEVVCPVLVYPMDVLGSLFMAGQAPFDPDLDIEWGPVGAVAGIVLPWVTLLPDLYSWTTVEDVELSPAAFSALLDGIRNGDGIPAYEEILEEAPWPAGQGPLISVELEGDVRPVDALTEDGPKRLPVQPAGFQG